MKRHELEHIEVHDLAISKLVAGREKDLVFVATLLRHRLADPSTLRQRIALTVIPTERLVVCEGRLSRVLRDANAP
jgi:hypothetical protein